MMRKWFMLCSAAVLIILAGCSEEEPVAGDGEAPAEKEEETQAAEEVFAEAKQAAEGVESMEGSSQFTMSEDVDVLEMDRTGEIILDPLRLYHQVSFSELGEAEEIEFYLDGEEMYLLEPVSKEWIQTDMPAEVEQFLGMFIIREPMENLALIEDAVDKMDVEEIEETYVLSLKTDEKEFRPVIVEMLYAEIGESSPDSEEFQDVLTGEEGEASLDYELTLNKETYDVETITFEIELHDNQGELHGQATSETEYTGINTVDSIELPESIELDPNDL